ncbi:MAG TPA: hypothetical protein VMW36_09495 [Patescibacteria group bacterium]|nr:hypothetical protein [Patescibacteria group bacterium]
MELGEVIQKFIDYEIGAQECHAEVDIMFAPSECHGLVQRSLDKELNDLFDSLREQDWPPARIKKEIEDRGISYKWLYEHGVSYLVHISDELGEDPYLDRDPYDSVFLMAGDGRMGE